jgi:hypothetical protein
MRPVTSISPDWYFLGVNPKCAPYPLGGLEAAGIVDCRGVGQSADRADARRRHQQPHAAILARQRSETLFQLLPLPEKRSACCEQRFGNG